VTGLKNREKPGNSAANRLNRFEVAKDLIVCAEAGDAPGVGIAPQPLERHTELAGDDVQRQ
jgi:hypothetical protein